MSTSKEAILATVLTVLFCMFAVTGLEAKCRSSKQSKGMGCCNMKDMNMEGTQEGQTAQGMKGKDCCRMMDMKGDTRNMSDMDATGEKSPAAGKIIQSRHADDLVVAISNEGGQLTRGPNSFCVEFRKDDKGQMPDVGAVQVDFTMPDMEGMHAAAQVTRNSMGRYCGRVTLTMAGEWSAVVNYQGPSGNAKAGFNVTVR